MGGICIKQNSEKLNEYLNSGTEIDKIEKALIVLLILGNFFTFLAAFTDPYDNQMFKIITRLEIVMSLSIIFTIFIINRRRNLLILFSGISYFFVALTFAAAIYKEYAIAGGIASNTVIAIEILIFILVLSCVFIYHFLNLRSEKKVLRVSSPIVLSTISASFLGLAIGRIAVRNLTDIQANLFFGMCLMYFMIICTARIINIHKYYLIKKYNFQFDEERSE